MGQGTVMAFQATLLLFCLGALSSDTLGWSYSLLDAMAVDALHMSMLSKIENNNVHNVLLN